MFPFEDISNCQTVAVSCWRRFIRGTVARIEIQNRVNFPFMSEREIEREWNIEDIRSWGETKDQSDWYIDQTSPSDESCFIWWAPYHLGRCGHSQVRGFREGNRECRLPLWHSSLQRSAASHKEHLWVLIEVHLPQCLFDAQSQLPLKLRLKPAPFDLLIFFGDRHPLDALFYKVYLRSHGTSLSLSLHL